MSPKFPETAWLPRLSQYAESIPFFRGITTHGGLILGIIAAVILWFIVYRSRWGYEIRLIGDNPHAAKHAGISITRNTIWVMMLSGALAGLGNERSGGGGAPFADRAHRGGIWLYRHHCRVAGETKSACDHSCFRFVWRVDPCRAGNSALRRAEDARELFLLCLIASDFMLRYRIRIVRGEEA